MQLTKVNRRPDGLRHQLAGLIAMILAVTLGGGSLLAFALFLFVGSPQVIDLRLDAQAALLIDAGLSLAFFVQHSGMIRRSFRRWLSRFIPKPYHGTTYAIASGVALFLAVLLWQESSVVIGAVHGELRWLARAAFFLAAGGIVWSFLALGSFDAFGLDPIRCHLRARVPSVAEFVVRGPYRWVRHPQYMCILVMIWCYPDVTADRVLFNLMWSVWIVTGTLLEERDLVTEFGEQYRTYQARVPMLLPYRKPATGG